MAAESCKSCRQLDDDFHIGGTQASSILKRKQNCCLVRKLQKTSCEDVNVVCWDSFQTARSQNIPRSGPMVQEEELEYGRQLGNTEFKASNWWLESSHKRHNFAFHVICGEAADISPVTIDDWKQQIPSIINGYKLDNICNCDETGLFYRALPDKTLAIKDQECREGKWLKERVTALLCCNATGTDLYRLFCFCNMVFYYSLHWQYIDTCAHHLTTFFRTHEKFLLKV